MGCTMMRVTLWIDIFFQIVPSILSNEILADLTKEAEDPRAVDRIAGNSYRISGNRGLTPDYRFVLGNSLIGNEIPMSERLGHSTIVLTRHIQSRVARHATASGGPNRASAVCFRRLIG